MEFLKDRRNLLLLAGAAVALVAGGLIAFGLMASHRGETADKPPASQAGLVIDTTGPVDAKMDPARPLRCFVAGQFVGELTLADCAKRNGVATGALDVGVDETGALAAADQGGALLTPLPPEPETTPQTDPTLATTAAAAGVVGPAGACWSYVQGKWSRLPAEQPLSACVQTLFAGHCEKQGGATYGRWMQQTLRLVAGKVEVSGDNHSFRTLVEQGPGCVIPPVS